MTGLWTDNLTFEVSSADPESSSPVWVDLTSRVRGTQATVELSTGRQNDLERAEPSRLTLTLNNFDDALTYGNTSSPYTSWWGPGRKCRLREIVGLETLDRFTGYLEMPIEGLSYAGEQWVTISAIDQLGRWDRTPTFVSTLAAYILNNHGGTLEHYWPLLDASGSLRARRLYPSASDLLTLNAVWANNVAQPDGFPALEFGTFPGPPGDDGLTPEFTAILSGTTIASHFGLSNALLADNIAADELYGFVAWVYVSSGISALTGTYTYPALRGSGGSNPIFAAQADPTNRTWAFSITTGTGTTGTVNVGRLKTDGWSILGCFLNASTGAASFWVDDQSGSGSIAGASTGTVVEVFALADPSGSSIGHFQVYSGPSTQINQPWFLAQFAAGYSGLDRQTTGDRIKTIARYAGKTDSDLLQVDAGCTVMSRAQLAGQTILAAMREAETTEQGLLYVDGSGNLTFADRRTLDNI